MKHLKTLGLVAVAIAALTAFVGVSSASAAQFTSTSSPVMLFGEDNGKHVFKVDGQSVTCNVGKFEKASLTTPANVIPGVTAAYSSCTAFGFAGATVNMGNCTYEFLQPNASFEGNVAFRCNSSGKATVFSSVFGSECEVTIGEASNTNLSKVTYKNLANSPTKVEMTAAVTGITANKVKDNGLCPLSGTGSTSNATYEGPTVVEGTSGIGISVS